MIEMVLICVLKVEQEFASQRMGWEGDIPRREMECAMTLCINVPERLSHLMFLEDRGHGGWR